MGDRANVQVISRSEKVTLYTHWAGSELPVTLRLALARGKSRWTDFPYLSRIIFSEMIEGNERNLTGFGISQEIGDGADRVAVVNVDAQTVRLNGGPAVCFEDYVNQDLGWET